jgi:hypothetical protein
MPDEVTNLEGDVVALLDKARDGVRLLRSLDPEEEPDPRSRRRPENRRPPEFELEFGDLRLTAFYQPSWI